MRIGLDCAVLLGVLLTAPLHGAPPGAMVRARLAVPDALRNGVFSGDRYLTIPPGFQISVFANVPGARFMALAPNGDVLVSQPNAGKVTLLRPTANGGVPQAFTFAGSLRRPHDIVFHTVGGLNTSTLPKPTRSIVFGTALEIPRPTIVKSSSPGCPTALMALTRTS